MSLITPEELIVFECPYCQHKHNLTRLIAATYIEDLTSVFECADYWSEDSRGCGKKFLLELKPFYTTDISKIEYARSRA